jgi:hypothetical protein
MKLIKGTSIVKLSLPLINLSDEDLGIDTGEDVGVAYIDLNSVSAIRPAYDESFNQVEGETLIQLFGEPATVFYCDFAELLTLWIEIKKNQNNLVN